MRLPWCESLLHWPLPCEKWNVPSRRTKFYLVMFVVFGAVAALIPFAKRLLHHETQPVAPAEISSGTDSPQTISANSNPPASPAIITNSSAAGLQQTRELLQAASNAQSAKQYLAELRETLSAMPKNEAASVLQKFLDSKADAGTHLGFKIGNNGVLDEAPTLRIYLLDELARIDPAAAADYARTILATKDSPDEWAVALRNLARGDSSNIGRELLKQKTSEMLQYEPWQQNPSVGFLEAFDVAVYLGDTGLMPILTDLVRQQDNSAVAHASYLALDRLIINDPTTTLTALLSDPDSMQGRELTRADYFARADVRNAQQRQILETYLLNPKITPAEIDAFVGIFPNANFMISPNLLTQSQTIDRNTLVNRDAESLRVAQEWLADPRFAQLRPELQKTVVRLQEFVRQANERP